MDDTRSFDHQGLEVLTAEECWELIRSQPVGRVAYMDAGQPMILPVNHGLMGHQVVIRTGRGALLNEAMMDRSIAFEVDSFDPGLRTGWSVVVRGVAKPVYSDVDLGSLGLDPWADGIARDDVLALRADEVSGRRIVRAPSGARADNG